MKNLASILVKNVSNEKKGNIYAECKATNVTLYETRETPACSEHLKSR